MKPLCKREYAVERGIALVLFTLSLPALLGLVILGVDLGNLFLTRDKLNLLNRSAAATAVNARALYGWAPLACTGQDTTASKLGYTCATAISETAPRGEKYPTLISEIENTLLSQIRTLFPDSITNTSTNTLVEYGLPATNGGTSWYPTWVDVNKQTIPIYNLRDDKFQLKIRYGVKTILLSQLASLLNIRISSLCNQPSGTDLDKDRRCWVETSDSLSNSATVKANIIMLLDTSGSMQTKQAALKSAAAAFIDYFNPFKDEIGVIPYGTGVKAGTINRGTFNTAGTAGLLAIKNNIANYVMGGQTNPCDALINSMGMIPTNTGSSPATRTFVVLFTDGAPNVYRLAFCDPATSTTDCTPPTALNTVSTTNDWYGWTVKWGRRLPKDGTLTKNPFFSYPQIKSSTGDTNFNTEDTSLFRINEKGEFMVKGIGINDVWCNMELPLSACAGAPTNGGAPYDQLPYSRVFKTLSTAEDNYLWNGPSYLVNRAGNSIALSQVQNLIDRVDSSFKTCGLPKPPPPNTNPPTLPTDFDQFNYNHSLYFASRVLDRNWTLGRYLFGSKQRYAVYLRQVDSTQLKRSPPLDFDYPPNNTTQMSDFTVPFYISEKPGSSPITFNATDTTSAGCLEALDAQIPDMPGIVGIPNTPPKLFVGAGNSSFWSNTTADSIGQVGEIIKSAELPYYCAVRAADYLRTAKNVTVFAVGLGDGAQYTYGESCPDPLQNALDFDRRKDFFLRRLTFAPEGINYNGQTTLARATWQPQVDFGLRARNLSSCESTHPLDNQTVYLGFSQVCGTDSTGAPTNLAISPTTGQCKNPFEPPGDPGSQLLRSAQPSEFSSDVIGGYYPTSDPTKLSAQFAAIAKQILFRLTL